MTTGLQLPVVLPITSSSNAKIPHKNALVKYDDHNDGGRGADDHSDGVGVNEMREGTSKAYVMFGIFRDNRDISNTSDRLARVVVNHNSTGYYIDGFEDAIYAIKVKGGAAVNPAPLWNQSSSGITPPSTYKISQLFNHVKMYFHGDA